MKIAVASVVSVRIAPRAATAVIVFLPKDRRNLQWPLVGLIALLGIAAIAVRALTF